MPCGHVSLGHVAGCSSHTLTFHMARQSDLNAPQACRDTPWLHGSPSALTRPWCVHHQATLVCVVVCLPHYECCWYHCNTKCYFLWLKLEPWGFQAFSTQTLTSPCISSLLDLFTIKSVKSNLLWQINRIGRSLPHKITAWDNNQNVCAVKTGLDCFIWAHLSCWNVSNKSVKRAF